MNAEPGFEIEKPRRAYYLALCFPQTEASSWQLPTGVTSCTREGAAPEPGDLSPALLLEAAAEDGGWGACSAGWCYLKRAELGHAGLSQGPREV